MVGTTAERWPTPRERRRIAVWATATTLLLLVPLVAMSVTNEVDWTAFDFVFAGALLLGVGLTYELIARTTALTTYRAALGVALAGAFALVWVNAAVGVIGSENNDANLMFAGVLAVGARLRPEGMARALLATALAQTLVGAIALIAGLGSREDALALTAFFVALWLTSAHLFRRAARQHPSASTTP
jgi:hypothetical protein